MGWEPACVSGVEHESSWGFMVKLVGALGHDVPVSPRQSTEDESRRAVSNIGASSPSLAIELCTVRALPYAVRDTFRTGRFEVDQVQENTNTLRATRQPQHDLRVTAQLQRFRGNTERGVKQAPR